MAKRKAAPPAMPLELKDVPTKKAVWQVDARPLDVVVKSPGQDINPWVVIVVSVTDGEILALEMLKKAPTPKQVRDVVLQAITRPGRGKPHIPMEIRIFPGKRMKALQTFLKDSRVRCAHVNELHLIDEVLDQMLEDLDDDDYQPGLLDRPNMTNRIVGSFFAAAAGFFDKTPWKKAGERTLRIESTAFEGGNWYGVLMGSGEMAAGLVLYDSLELLNQIKEGKLSDEESARQTSALAVVFGPEDDMVEADLESIQLYGWKVASESAFPAVYRKKPGLIMVAPEVWELQLLEACLRAIPDFVKLRHAKPVETEVDLSNQKVAMKLSWC